MNATPDFRIERLGAAEVHSPLSATQLPGQPSLFVRDDERCLYDTTGFAWQHTQMPMDVSAINFEVAGPREFIYFDPAQTRAAIVTCGGVCPGLNNVIRGLVHILLLQYRIKE